MLSDRGRAAARRVFVVSAACAVVTAALPAQAYAAGGTIAGRVTDASGNPLSDVCVRISHPQAYSSPIASATTAADGTYAVVAPTGTHVVSFVDCGGRDLVTSFWRNADTRYAATTITVADGATVTGVDGTLAQGGSMSGRVLRTDGSPVRYVSADIRLVARNNTPLPEDTDVTTAADGTWSARGLPPGSYRIAFYSQDQTLANVLYGNTSKDADSPKVQVVAGQALTGLDATLPRPGTISGTVRDDDGAPHEGVCVAAWTALGYENLQFYARTGADGTYTLPRLTPGSYRIEFTDCGNVTAPVWYPAALSFASATPVTVAEGMSATGIDATFSRGLSVSGTVRTVDGTPAERIGVALYDGITGSYTGRSTHTNANGEYRIVGLRGTVYKLHFYGGGTDELVDRWWPGVAAQAAALPVSLVAGVSVADVDVTLPKGGWISGRVTAADGGEAQGVCVYATNPVTGQGTGMRAGELGQYSLRGLDAGLYRVSYKSCQSANWAPHYYGGTDDPATADLVTVTLGEGTDGIDATVTPGGVITGTVTDTAGNPISQVCVLAESGTARLGPGYSHTDDAGRYTITSLAPYADYRVEFVDCYVRPGRYVTTWNGGVADRYDAPMLDVRAGQEVAGVDVTMQRGGSFSGTVTDQFGKPLYGVCVGAYDESTSRGTWHTGQQGTYDIGGLAPGTYRAVFWDCGAGLVAGAWYGAPIVVREGEDTPGVDVELVVITTPTAPLDVVVVPGDTAATLSWKAPADDGHSPVTNYEVRDAGGSVVATTGATARTTKVSGLANGTTYAFTVNAVNAKGTGDSSAAVSVRPRAAGRLSVTAPSSVVSGSYATVTGRLTNPAGTGIAATRVDLYGRRRGATTAMTRLAGATTTSTGSFTVSIRPVYPMEYAVRWAGSDTVLPASVTKVVPVSPRLTVSASGRTVYATVSPAAGGGRARLQVWRDGGWVAIRGADVPSTGRVSFRAPSGGLYRVVVVRSGWATATGSRLRLA